MSRAKPQKGGHERRGKTEDRQDEVKKEKEKIYIDAKKKKGEKRKENRNHCEGRVRRGKRRRLSPSLNLHGRTIDNANKK
jgi:hypothetical protein